MDIGASITDTTDSSNQLCHYWGYARDASGGKYVRYSSTKSCPDVLWIAKVHVPVPVLPVP